MHPMKPHMTLSNNFLVLPLSKKKELFGFAVAIFFKLDCVSVTKWLCQIRRYVMPCHMLIFFIFLFNVLKKKLYTFFFW